MVWEDPKLENVVLSKSWKLKLELKIEESIWTLKPQVLFLREDQNKLLGSSLSTSFLHYFKCILPYNIW